MRLLATAGADLDRADLVQLYAYPDPVPGRAWVRINMVATLDGAVHGADGRSGSINTPADKRVFSVLRGLADVVVAGAGTVRAEDYSRPRVKPEDAERRHAAGRSTRPCLAVVTASGDVPAALLEAPGRDDSGWRVVVLTTETTDQDALARLRTTLGEECVLQVGTDTVDATVAVDALAERGLARVLCEGGPSLLGRWLAADRVDELCHTSAPVVVGGDAGRIVTGPPLTDGGPWRLGHLLEDDGTLLARWVRR